MAPGRSDQQAPNAGLTRRRIAQLAAAAGAGAALAGPLRALAATTETYDDGNAEIPGGIEGEPEHVVVIGAGFAGLAAANALRNAGVEVTVLEGRRRLGGRAHTRNVGGLPIDVGCSWIHDPIGNPMTRFAEQAGVARTAADIELDLPTIRFWEQAYGGEVPLTDVVAAFGHALNFGESLADYEQRLGSDASVREAAGAYLNDQGLEGEQRSRAAFAIRLFAEQEENIFWNRISLSYAANYENPYDGAGQGDFPVGGYRRLVEAMAAGLEIRSGHAVERVRRSGERLVVVARRRGSGGKRSRIRASHVLVTVPLGVLKKGSIGFEPRLPADKRGAIRRLGFGRFEKVAMVFAEPFWEQGGKTHIVRNSDPYGFPITLDMQKLSGFPALTALYAGLPARRLQRLSAERKIELAVAAIEDVLGPIPQPLDAYATAWRNDRFSRGGYSTVIRGRPVDADFDLLAEPVAGRLLFAGEATNSVRNGYSDGAMSSGIREAKRLLQRPAVELSAG